MDLDFYKLSFFTKISSVWDFISSRGVKSNRTRLILYIPYFFSISNLDSKSKVSLKR